MADFDSYFFVGDVDLKALRKLHDLVADYTSRFFSDEDLQDHLVNEGCKPDKERPKSFRELFDRTFLRTRTSFHLSFLERVVDVATNPGLVVIGREASRIISYSPGDILFPSTPRISATTADGYSIESVEEFQEQWLKSPEVVRDVRELQSYLQRVFDEFNLKYVLFAIHNSSKTPDYLLKDKEASIQEEIAGVFGRSVDSKRGMLLNQMDSAYYNLGKRFFAFCQSPWERLNASEFGRKFILSPEEDAGLLKKIYSRGGVEPET